MKYCTCTLLPELNFTFPSSSLKPVAGTWNQRDILPQAPPLKPSASSTSTTDIDTNSERRKSCCVQSTRWNRSNNRSTRVKLLGSFAGFQNKSNVQYCNGPNYSILHEVIVELDYHQDIFSNFFLKKEKYPFPRDLLYFPSPTLLFLPFLSPVILLFACTFFCQRKVRY